jgi:hypothetical protein
LEHAEKVKVPSIKAKRTMTEFYSIKSAECRDLKRRQGQKSHVWERFGEVVQRMIAVSLCFMC